MNPEKEGQELPPRDAFREVYFGQLAQPLVPDHPEAPEAEEDELTQAALSDPDSQRLSLPQNNQPTLWRVVALVIFAIAALGIVFVWR